MGLLQKIRHKLTRKTREAWFNCSFKFLDRIPKRIKSARGLRILVYHGVCPGSPHLLNARYVSAGQLEKHLLVYKRLYNIISFEDLATGNLSPDKLNVLLTFDDGLQNNYTQALPVLKRHGIPALFFATALASSPTPCVFNDLTDLAPLIGPRQVTINGGLFYRKKIFLHYRYVNAQGMGLAAAYHAASQAEREQVMRQLLASIPAEGLAEYKIYHELMTAQELSGIAQTPGMAVASHGQYHTSLPALSPEALAEELKVSKAYPEQSGCPPVNAIAFPYGDYNQQVADACVKAGYRYCFGTDKTADVKTRARLFERFTINPYVSAINQAYYIAMNHYA